MRPTMPTLISSQQGATLIIALIFLVVLGLLGVTVASNNTLQERMAGNTRNRDLAFQAAEHSLETADAILGDTSAPINDIKNYIDVSIARGAVPTPSPLPTLPSLPACLLLNGESHPNDLDYWKNTFDWSSACSPSTTLAQIHAQPQYVVEKMPDANVDADPALEQFYRVTVRGVGGIDEAPVILQAMYRYD